MAPPLPRFQNLPDEQRREILDAAASEFAEHGFAGASFNRIIAAAGVSKGAMYYYFADKADAYVAVVDDVLERARLAVADLPEPQDAASFWQVLGLGFARLNQEFATDARAAALGRSLYQNGDSDPGLVRLTDKVRGWTGAWVELGQRLGAVRDDLPSDLLADVATGTLLALDRWSVDALEKHGVEKVLALAPRMLELMQNLLRPN